MWRERGGERGGEGEREKGSGGVVYRKRKYHRVEAGYCPVYPDVENSPA
jgi:hypothetical protein